MIYFDHITKEFPRGVVALKDVTFHVKPKEFVSIVGASGAGKSTIVNLIIRDEIPTSGRIYVGGIDLSQLKKADIPHFRRHVGVVFQDYKLLPKKTVYENVAFPLEVSGTKAKEIKKIVSKIIQMVGLLPEAKKFPKELSGGEEQRAAIARALVTQPKVLIADEPTGNLDPRNSWGIVELLLKINRFGTTVLLTTHNREVINALKKRVISLSRGKIIRDIEGGRYAI